MSDWSRTRGSRNLHIRCIVFWVLIKNQTCHELQSLWFYNGILGLLHFKETLLLRLNLCRLTSCNYSILHCKKFRELFWRSVSLSKFSFVYWDLRAQKCVWFSKLYCHPQDNWDKSQVSVVIIFSKSTIYISGGFYFYYQLGNFFIELIIQVAYETFWENKGSPLIWISYKSGLCL